MQAHDGAAHALRPAHAALDGDIVFAASTGRRARPPRPRDPGEIGMTAADKLPRAIARGIFEATAPPYDGAPPTWRDLFAAKR